VGIVAGNLFDVKPTTWIDFLAGFGSGLLTFLAGAEIRSGGDPQPLEANAVDRFLSVSCCRSWAPWLSPLAVGWDMRAAENRGHRPIDDIGGRRLRGDGGIRSHETTLGKIILAACFVTDFGTVLALGVLFVHYNGICSRSSMHGDHLAACSSPGALGDPGHWRPGQRGGD